MKIHLVSDIHTESAPFHYCAPVSADVIVLAGDISQGSQGLTWARKNFPEQQVIYISGNHEYYGHDLSVIDSMRDIARKLDIHFLENDAVIIDGVRFLGCTLWTNLNNFSLKDIQRSWEYMSDFGTIKAEKWWNNKENQSEAFALMNPEFNMKSFYQKSFSPIIAYLLHQNSIAWLTRKLAEKHKKTVVVTHHAPSFNQLKDEYYWADLQHSYCSDLSDFIAKNNINFWLHGHIHQRVDYMINNTRIMSNAAGYKGQETGFDKGLLVDV